MGKEVATKPETAAAEKRKVVKGTVDYVLQTNVKVDTNELIKKGTRVDLQKDAELYGRLKRKAIGSLIRVNETIVEVAEDVELNVGKIIKHGTVLDPKKDAALIEELKKVKGAFASVVAVVEE